MRIVFPLLLVVSVAASANAKIIRVTTFDDSVATDGETSLREAINEANSYPTRADEIRVPAGTYRIMQAGSGEDRNDRGDFDLLGPTTIVGMGTPPAPHAPTVTIDCLALDRAFDMRAAQPLKLMRIAIMRGNAPGSGGAVRAVAGAALTLDDCHFINNHAGVRGGAAFHVGGKLTIRHSRFEKNSCKLAGGAVRVTEGPVFVADTLFFDNHAELEGGGGLSAHQASLEIRRGRFFRNTASQTSLATAKLYGGGLYGTRLTRGKLIEVTFDENELHAPNVAHGGAAYLEGPTSTVLEVLGCEFRRNTATGKEAYGGGLALLYAGTCRIGRVSSTGKESLFIANRAEGEFAEGGGAMVQLSKEVKVLDTEWDRNVAKTLAPDEYRFGAHGGALILIDIFKKTSNSVAIRRNLFIKNRAGSGGAVYMSDVLSSIASPGPSLFFGNTFSRNVAEQGLAATFLGSEVLVGEDNVFSQANQTIYSDED